MWVLELTTEKNKLAPSNYSIQVVLDKKFGINPVMSEYWFMANMSRWEIKVTGKKEEKLTYPLSVVTEGRSKVLVIYDPHTKKVIKKSDKFTEGKLYEKYCTDTAFRAIFNEAVDAAVTYRVRVGYFREIINNVEAATPVEDIPATVLASNIDDIIPPEEVEQEAPYIPPESIDMTSGEIIDSQYPIQ
jgi:hypothetical protein